LPYLHAQDAAGALELLVNAFGFTVIEALRGEDGSVWSAHLSTGDGAILIGPGIAEIGTRSILDPTWATSRVVDDVDGHFKHEEKFGAGIVAELADHGPNRIYVASDSGGQQWIFGSPIGYWE
jgi:uncharacterized glyoxalase superfamily protein PhnB